MVLRGPFSDLSHFMKKSCKMLFLKQNGNIKHSDIFQVLFKIIFTQIFRKYLTLCHFLGWCKTLKKRPFHMCMNISNLFPDDLSISIKFHKIACYILLNIVILYNISWVFYIIYWNIHAKCLGLLCFYMDLHTKLTTP